MVRFSAKVVYWRGLRICQRTWVVISSFDGRISGIFYFVSDTSNSLADDANFVGD